MVPVIFEYCLDPAGFFYYNDIETAKSANKYVSNNTRNPADNQLIAWVQFFKDHTLVAEVCHICFLVNILLTESFARYY